MSRPKTFYKNFLVLFSGNAIAQVIPFIFAPIIARIFSPEAFAVFGNFTALVSIIAIIAGGRYELAVVLPKKDEKAMNLIGLASKITIIITILSLSLYFFDGLIAELYKNNNLTVYLPYISVAIFLVSFNTILTQWFVRKKQYRMLSITKIIQSLILNVITILLGVLGVKLGGLIFGWCAGFLTGLILLLIFNKEFDIKKINNHEIKEVAKEYKEFPLINSLHAFTDILFSQFLLFAIITREFGLVYLGLFFVMNKYLKAPIRLIGSAVGQVYYREANEYFVNHKPVLPTVLQSVKIVAFFAIPTMTIVFFFAPWIFKIYLGSEWEKAGEYAQIMAIPILFNFLASPISSTPLIYKKQKTALLISVIGYTFSIVAIYIGIYLHYNFKAVLMLFAGVMSCYYAYLLMWYIYLAKTKS